MGLNRHPGRYARRWSFLFTITPDFSEGYGKMPDERHALACLRTRLGGVL